MKLVAFTLALATTASAQQLTGKWTTNIDTFGTPTSWNLTLDQKEDTVTGELGGDKLTGTLKGGKLVIHAQDPQGGYEDVTATLTGDTIKGRMIWAQNAAIDHPTTHTFTATRNVAKAPNSAPPRTHEFTPTIFRRQFSSEYASVLTVNPGDTIHTQTVDAGSELPFVVPMTFRVPGNL